jgi:hypothetical protein
MANHPDSLREPPLDFRPARTTVRDRFHHCAHGSSSIGAEDPIGLSGVLPTMSSTPIAMELQICGKFSGGGASNHPSL